jgi:hypothetical protein
VDALAVRLTIPPVGFVEDFHLLASKSALPGARRKQTGSRLGPVFEFERDLAEALGSPFFRGSFLTTRQAAASFYVKNFLHS